MKQCGSPRRRGRDEQGENEIGDKHALDEPIGFFHLEHVQHHQGDTPVQAAQLHEGCKDKSPQAQIGRTGHIARKGVLHPGQCPGDQQQHGDDQPGNAHGNRLGHPDDNRPQHHGQGMHAPDCKPLRRGHDHTCEEDSPCPYKTIQAVPTRPGPRQSRMRFHRALLIFRSPSLLPEVACGDAR